MKGKGKGKVSSALECKDSCPLGFIDFTPIDHIRACPRYATILQRAENDGVGQEDLDTLQLELEMLLLSVTKRRRQLEQEMQILVTWQEKKEKKAIVPEMGKRSRLNTHGKPKKRFKDGSGKAHPVPIGRPKSKHAQTKLQEFEFNEQAVDVMRQPKNDAPNRFWASLEPYCTDLTQDDLKILEDLIKGHDEDGDYYKIPALGKHYSLRWAQEDMLEEQKEGGRVNEKRRGLSNSSSLNSSEAERLLKKAEKERETEDTPPFGSLTQRLVSCLIEENLMSNYDNSLEGTGKEVAEEGSSPPATKPNFIKSLNISNAVTLEKRIRRELEEQGILDAADETAADSGGGEDEIMTELRKCQNELKAVASFNMGHTKRLLKMAKDEVNKQEVKKRLQMADAEVTEVYRRIVAARQKKRSPTKKERDQAWKTLKDREHILKQLDGLNQNN